MSNFVRRARLFSRQSTLSGLSGGRNSPPHPFPLAHPTEAVADDTLATWTEVAFAGAVAVFTFLLWRLERNRERADFQLVKAVPVQLGVYKMLVLNKGGHDSSIEYVKYTRHMRGSSSELRCEPRWVRRTAKDAAEVRGLGLMVRSGERLWFTVKCFEPSTLDEHTAGMSLHVKGVLDKRERSIQLQGATLVGDGRHEPLAPADAIDTR